MMPRNVGISLSMLAVLVACVQPQPGIDDGTRLTRVAAIGAQVMPFDLDRTTHIFADAAWGGEQRVMSDDGDVQQVGLIRAHLSREAVRFARGEFDDPAAIHGAEMPGLAVLRAKYARVEVTYTDTVAGGAIAYRSDDAEAVQAIHAWFAAQRSDHGAHAAH